MKPYEFKEVLEDRDLMEAILGKPVLAKKRPIIIEAMKLKGDRGVTIPTLEGCMTANPGDWVLRGIQGEYYPCKDSIFKMTYDIYEE